MKSLCKNVKKGKSFCKCARKSEKINNNFAILYIKMKRKVFDPLFLNYYIRKDTFQLFSPACLMKMRKLFLCYYNPMIWITLTMDNLFFCNIHNIIFHFFVWVGRKCILYRFIHDYILHWWTTNSSLNRKQFFGVNFIYLFRAFLAPAKSISLV